MYNVVVTKKNRITISSIAIPVCNSQETFLELSEHLIKTRDKLSKPYGIIFVDHLSRDTHGKYLKKYKSNIRKLLGFSSYQEFVDRTIR